MNICIGAEKKACHLIFLLLSAPCRLAVRQKVAGGSGESAAKMSVGIGLRTSATRSWPTSSGGSLLLPFAFLQNPLKSIAVSFSKFGRLLRSCGALYQNAGSLNWFVDCRQAAYAIDLAAAIIAR
jgi:hypothetical protein